MITTTVFADIVRTSTLDSIKTICQEIDKDTLIIFDVDHVLIMPTDEYTVNRHPYRKKLLKAIEQKLSTEERKDLYGVTASKAKWQLVDPNIIDIFSYLKQRNVLSIALTSIYTGKYGVIDKIEDWRIAHLNDFGFYFAQLSPIKETLLLPELSNKRDGIPMIKSGVVFTAQIDKALVLERIMKHYDYYPKTIIFIDDQLSNLESLEKLSSKLNIKFYGVHYTAVSEFPEPVIDEQKEKLRFEILEKEHQWLSYEELDQRTVINSANNKSR